MVFCFVFALNKGSLFDGRVNNANDHCFTDFRFAMNSMESFLQLFNFSRLLQIPKSLTVISVLS